MKKTIGMMALLLTSGAALLLPATAAARDRDDYGYYGQRETYRQEWHGRRERREVRRDRDRRDNSGWGERHEYRGDYDRR